MKEFTLVLDCFNIKELDSYLKTIDGVKEVSIEDDYLVTINVKYDSKIINNERIRLEILAFLDLLNYPCVYGFNLHYKDAAVYNVICDHICCDFCFFNMIEDLSTINGITGVDSNFYKKFWTKELKNEKYHINVFYNPKIISKKQMVEIVKKLDIVE